MNNAGHRAQNNGKAVSSIALSFYVCALMIFLFITPATAVTCDSCVNVDAQTAETIQHIIDEHDETRDHITEEFEQHNELIINFIRTYIQPALMAMTGEMSATALQNAASIGGFFDAKTQLETQRLIQQRTAETHKNYRPSMSMCVFGTNIRSLAATERAGDRNRMILSQWSQNRQTGNANSNATEGEHSDRLGRLNSYRDRYCDVSDNNGQTKGICPAGSAPAKNINKDIDYNSTLDRPRTLKIDFSDGSASDDEQNILALASNLYAHRVLVRMPENVLHNNVNKQRILDIRALTAKRSVAEAPFSAIAGLKAQSTAGTGNAVIYMRKIMEQLGINEDLSDYQIGERPSYFAQMEILTKKIYQDPAFYTDLYETPANTQRKKVAMQAIGLMQDFDTLESHLRTEMMLSVLLEVELEKAQQSVQNTIAAITQ